MASALAFSTHLSEPRLHRKETLRGFWHDYCAIMLLQPMAAIHNHKKSLAYYNLKHGPVIV